MDSKEEHIHKYASFSQEKKTDAPFCVKEILDSEVNGTLLYSFEIWITPSLTPVNTLHLSALKLLLENL